MSLPFPISAPQPGTGKTTLLSRETWHIGHPWHQRWSQIGVVCSMNIQNGSIGTYFILPRNNLKASSTWTDGEFWQTSWVHFRLCSEPDNWARVQWKAGLDNTVSTTPDVVTGSHQLSKFDTVVATFTDNHWWLNKSCSWISKIVGSKIPGWCCVQVSVPFFPK